uniref:Uncharacterized protein n=1 Tax=viral metagenome TaxID=1070528 RepID=A0A6M3LGI5_9ZZZZ
MKLVFDFDKLMRSEQAHRRGPGDSTHVGEDVKLSLQDKPVGEKGDLNNEKKT